MTNLSNNSQKSSYEKDIYNWALTQANLIRKGELSKLDLENIAEEIEDLGNSQLSALESQLIRIMMHMLKIEYQSERHGKSWDKSIGNARVKVEKIIDKNPSLRSKLKSIMINSYRYARKMAHVETGLDITTFPIDCPWTLKEILGE